MVPSFARDRNNEEDLDALSARFIGYSTHDLIESILAEEFHGDAAVLCSFGAESVVLLSLVAKIDSATPVLFLDTLRHFPETLSYRDLVVERLGLSNVISVTPDRDTLDREDARLHLAMSDPDRCCAVRKTMPMFQAAGSFRCLLTGRKRFQSNTRRDLMVFERWHSWVKVNPLANWTKAEIQAHVVAHSLPQHPLERRGFRSIGCEPCTRPITKQEDERAGRWSGSLKTECGIHFAGSALDGSRTGWQPYEVES